MLQLNKGNQMFTFKKRRSVAACTVAAFVLFGCGTVEEQNRGLHTQTEKSIQQAQEKSVEQMPVVSKIAGSWLMGETVQVAPPVSPLLQQPIAWRPNGKVTLIEVGTHLAQESGLIVDTSEVQVAPSASALSATSAGSGAAGSAATLARPQDIFGAMAGQSAKLPEFFLGSDGRGFEGTRAALLDYTANKSGVWWKFADGKVTFFRSVTETIYIPAAARKSTGTSTISATSGPSNSGGSSGSTPGSSAVTAGTSTGGLTSTDEYAIDVWTDLEKTARVVAGGASEARIATNKALSSITVTGTPVQVKNVREWARGLTDNLSQQVAITATMYTVDITNEDYYSWDPTIIFNKISSAYTYGFNGAQAPAVTSSVTPAGLGVSVLSNASGGTSSLSGSQAALKALSSLGHVTSNLHGSVVTMNGVKAPMQIGRQIGYIPSTSTTTSSNVGATTSIQTGSITVGFTANFYPQIINGKILLSMDVINSALDRLPTRTSGNASVQTPETSSSSFSQSVSLTPGDAIMLTGFSQDSGQTNKTGVGSPNNPVFGGGTDAVRTKKMIAIVISAKVL